MSNFKCVPPWQPSTTTTMPFEWANWVISLIGKTAPVTLDKWVIAIILVLSVISLSIFSIGISPSSLISANFILIFFDFLKKCHGT